MMTNTDDFEYASNQKHTTAIETGNPFATPAYISPDAADSAKIRHLGEDEDLLELAAVIMSRAKLWICSAGIILLLITCLHVLAAFYSTWVIADQKQLVVRITVIFIYGVSGVLLMRFHNKVSHFVFAPYSRALEDAMEAEQSYWKFVALATLAFAFIFVAVALTKFFMS